MTCKPLNPASLEAVKGQTIYPAPFNRVVSGRTKRKLGDQFGLSNFGINQTLLDPGSASAVAHSHSLQDEFIYVLSGTPTVRVGDQQYLMQPGECIGFKSGTGIAHQLLNLSDAPVSYLEIGDRSRGDEVDYPLDDLKLTTQEDGTFVFTRKDG